VLKYAGTLVRVQAVKARNPRTHGKNTFLFLARPPTKALVKPKHSVKSPQPALEPRRRFFYFTAAVAGAAVMIIEILGARLLAPYFGTSHFVWIAQIAVTLGALAAGYYAGGYWADRSARLDHFYGMLASAAVWVALTTRMLEPVSYASLRWPLAWGTLLASTCLFFVPLAILATTGPFLLRQITRNADEVGGNAGRLTAISTIGSFLGTGLIGYTIVPYVPNSLALLATAGAMGIPSILFFAVGNRKSRWFPLLLLAAGGSLVGIGWGWERDRHSFYPGFQEVYRGNSHYGQLQVLQSQSDGRRYYLNDFLIQNTYDPVEKRSASLFTYMLHGLTRAYHPDIHQVLCIGMGVGIVPMEFAREGAEVDVVEINPSVLPVAQKYFNCEPKLLHLAIDDGRHFLRQTRRQYDAVILDAFLGDSPPSHLMTREALTAIRQVLKPEGVLVMNCFGELPPKPDFFRDSLVQTLQSVFNTVRLHASGNGNLFFVASRQKRLAMVQHPNPDAVHPSCQFQFQLAWDSAYDLTQALGMVLTDDYNPVEFYDARAREQVRRALALGMKRQFD
jgi:spermidine synthase